MPNHPTSRRAATRPRTTAGFSMVEMLGVVTVMAILSAIIAVSALNSIKVRRRDAESLSMTSIASTLKTTVLRTKYIPAATNWATTLASYMAEPVNKLSTTAAGNTRVLLVDPALRLGTNASSVLPFTQTRAGTIQPSAHARVVLISSIAGPLPTIASDSNTFTSIWSVPPDGVPEGWSDFSGRGKDLRFVRLDLRNLFSRVVLENLDYFRSAPYSVETTNTLTSVPAGSRAELWLLNTTVMNFHFDDLGKTVQGREYITEDVSYTYENGRWGRYVRYGLNRNTGWFGEMVDRFLAAPRPTWDTRRFASQQWAIEAMYVYLWNFGQWSLDAFPSGPPWPHTPAYELEMAGAQSLISVSSDLLITAP